MQFASQKITEKTRLQHPPAVIILLYTGMYMGVVPQVVEWGRGYGGSCEGWNKVITTPECDKSNVNMKKALSSSVTCYLEQVDELVCWYKQGLDGLCFMMYFVSLSGKPVADPEGARGQSPPPNKKQNKKRRCL